MDSKVRFMTALTVCSVALTVCVVGLSWGTAARAGTNDGDRKDCKPLLVANAYVERLRALDVEGSMALLNDDMDYQGPWGNKMNKTQLRAWYVAEFPKLSHESHTDVVGTTCEGERVAIESVGWWKLTDGSVYHNIYHHLFVVKNGKISSFHQYLNTEAFSKDVKMRQ